MVKSLWTVCEFVCVKFVFELECDCCFSECGVEVFADCFESEELGDFVECFCLFPSLFQLLLGVFSSVPVDLLCHCFVSCGWVCLSLACYFFC